MPSQPGVLAVRPHHHGHGIPACERANAPFERGIAWRTPFLIWRYGIQVRGVCGVRKVGTGASRLIDEFLQDKMRPLHAFLLQDRLQRLDPLARLFRIDVYRAGFVIHNPSRKRSFSTNPR